MSTPQKYVFKKAKDVIKSLILKHNPEASKLTFTDFEVSVSANNKQLQLQLKDRNNPKYKNADPVTFNYTCPTIADVLTHMGISNSHPLSEKDAIIAKMPDEFECRYIESDKTLTVSLNPINNTVGFDDSDNTSCATILVNESITIRFTAARRVNLDNVVTTPELVLDAHEILEDI